MKATTVSLLVALALLVVGLLALFIPVAIHGWDLTVLDPHRYTESTHPVAGEFTAISVETSLANVTVLPSEDGTCRAVLCEQEGLTHTVAVEDGTLRITETDTRRWYEKLINLRSPSITLYLPEGSYGALTVSLSTGDVTLSEGFTFASLTLRGSTGDVACRADVLGAIDVRLSTGDVLLEGISAGAITLTASTGDTALTGVTCTSLTSSRSTGHTRLDGMSAEGDVTLTSSTGRIGLSRVSAGALSLYVSTGRTDLADVTATTLTSEGDTGDVTLINTVLSGAMSITRSTGDVTLTRCDATELLITTDTGDVEGTLLTEKIFIPRTDTGKIAVPETVTGGRCKVTTDTGDIRFTIAE